MILYSPAKINIGLHILRKRKDNFHELSSLMYPIPFYDIIEVHADFNSSTKLSFSNSGIIVPDPGESNLCSRAGRLFLEKTGKSADIKLHLHKQIPFGAGLGGGSSNASTVMLALNKLASISLDNDQLAQLAAQLGSDCPLFIYGKSMMASGRGDILKETSLNLKGYFLVLLYPGIIIPTAKAYKKVVPENRETALAEMLQLPVSDWKNNVANDFEDSVFSEYPLIKKLKQGLYNKGAIYASMSGSGSSVYALYKDPPNLTEDLEKHVCWKGRL